MIDGVGDGQQLFEDFVGFWIVLCFVGIDELDQQFWCDVVIIDQQIVNVEYSWQQLFVMVGQDLKFWIGFFQFWDFDILVFYVVYVVFGGDNVFLCGDFELCFEIVGCFGCVWILEQDFLQVRFFLDGFVVVLWCVFLVVEV